MKLDDLRKFWNENLEIIKSQEESASKSWRLAQWQSFQLPLAIDHSTYFGRHFASVWSECVQYIMEQRLRHVIAEDNNYYVTSWSIHDSAPVALSLKGIAIVPQPSNTEKRIEKIERYNQQKQTIGQFITTFYETATDDTPLRSLDVIKKAQHLIDITGIGCVNAQAHLNDSDLEKNLDKIINTVERAYEWGFPPKSIGLDGFNLFFGASDQQNLGFFQPDSNLIMLHNNDNIESTFWHEWMHMLEDRINHASELKIVPEELKKYHCLRQSMNNMNKSIKNAPKDAHVTHLYFSNPFSDLHDFVEEMCNKQWFKQDINQSLKGHDKHHIHILEDALKNSKISELVVTLNEWKNCDQQQLTNKDLDDVIKSYRDKSKMIVDFHNHLKTGQSNFLSAAKVLDRRRQGASYWSKPEELLARAFQEFTDQNKWHDSNDMIWSGRVFGQERTQINECFEKMIGDFTHAWVHNEIAHPQSTPDVSISAKQKTTRW